MWWYYQSCVEREGVAAAVLVLAMNWYCIGIVWYCGVVILSELCREGVSCQYWQLPHCAMRQHLEAPLSAVSCLLVVNINSTTTISLHLPSILCSEYAQSQVFSFFLFLQIEFLFAESSMIEFLFAESSVDCVVFCRKFYRWSFYLQKFLQMAFLFAESSIDGFLFAESSIDGVVQWEEDEPTSALMCYISLKPGRRWIC